MKIVIGSQSPIKIKAVQDAVGALGIQCEIVVVKASSGIAEQPVGEETALGAKNRAAHSQELSPGADMYIAIENGIFEESGRWIDKAVVLCVMKDGREHVAFSSGVEFPAESVAEAKKRGFDKVTVGIVMAEQRIVARSDDPHLSLSGKPRAAFLTEAVLAALTTLFPHGPISCLASSHLSDLSPKI